MNDAAHAQTPPPPEGQEHSQGRGLTRRSFFTIAAAASAAGLLLQDSAPRAVAAALPSFVPAGVQSAPGTTCYLMDEDFQFPNLVTDPVLMVPSGWDVRQAGGSFSAAYNRWAKITDSNPSMPVVMQKRFLAQTAGVITVDFRFEPVTQLNGVTWTIGAAGSAGTIATNAIVVAATASALTLQSPSGAVTLASYSLAQPVGVRVVADIDQNLVSVFVNGVSAASAVPFSQASTVLDTFAVQTADAYTGNFYFDAVRIHRGYLANESFITVPVGSVPTDWSMTGAGAVFSVKELHGSTYADKYSLLVDTTAATAPAVFARSVPAQTGDLTFSFRFLAPLGAQGLTATLSGGGTPGAQLSVASGVISYTDGSGSPVACYDCKANLWYDVVISVDPQNSVATIAINGKTAAAGVAIPTATSIDTVTFSVAAGTQGKVYLDDIRLFQTSSEPADYVPTPVPVDTGDYQVGVQTFAGWREGHHQGWDAITPYPSRKPLLGWYDEGDPELTDWCIKWLVENGVSFELSCWFRPVDGVGQPIKFPYLGHHLHDGLFKAKYKSMLKFAIMYENIGSGATNSSDFRTVMVPFWIEYYFRDPNYLVIDNKPVFSIFSFQKMKDTFGGTTAGVKAEIDFLRAAVQDAGFDDIILITPQPLSDAATVGVTAQYKYSVGSVAAFEDAYQMNLLQWRSTTAVVDVLPTISMGQDQQPWALTPGLWADVPTYEANATWVRDEFIPTLPSTSLGRSLVLVDNWNEFGEGHFVMPSALAGFGYVNGIRNVFGTTAGPSNVVPTATQLARINKLYPAGRTQPLREIPAPAKPDDYWHHWTFDTDGDTEGWEDDSNHQVINIQVAGGYLTGTSTGTDPGIVSADHLGIDAKLAPWVKIRMKSDTPAEYLFFTTEADGSWTQDKGVQIINDAANDEFGVAYVAVWGNPRWVGTIRQIRVDTMGTPGDFTIDEIGVVKVPLPSPGLLVAGKYDRVAQPSIASNGTPMVPAFWVAEATGGRPEWRPDTQWFVAVYGGTSLIAQIGSSTAHYGATSIHLDAPPVLVGGRVHVPASLFHQALGYTVTFDTTTQLITITP